MKTRGTDKVDGRLRVVWSEWSRERNDKKADGSSSAHLSFRQLPHGPLLHHHHIIMISAPSTPYTEHERALSHEDKGGALVYAPALVSVSAFECMCG